MSEDKKLRTEDEIRNEYTSACTKAGHIQFQLTMLTKDLEVLNKTLEALNFEALSVRRASEESKESK